MLSNNIIPVVNNMNETLILFSTNCPIVLDIFILTFHKSIFDLTSTKTTVLC